MSILSSEQEVDPVSLALLNKEDMKECGLPVGARNRLLRAQPRLRQLLNLPVVSGAGPAPPAPAGPASQPLQQPAAHQFVAHAAALPPLELVSAGCAEGQPMPLPHKTLRIVQQPAAARRKRTRLDPSAPTTVCSLPNCPLRQVSVLI